MALKLRIRPQFPANVLVESPILLAKAGSTYTFSFDANSAPAGPTGATGAAGAAGAGYGGTSTTSLLIANSVTKTFTTQAGLAYQVGNYVRVSSQANGANFMEGTVSSYGGGTVIAIAVTTIGGSGTHADWSFAIAGIPGTVGVATFNGASGAVVTSVVVQTFTASGTYTPTAGMKYAIIECQGSGAGAGGMTGTVGQTGASSAGGAGSYSRSVVTAAAVGASKTVTVGAAGTGGAAGANGVDGADVSVGTLCIGKGGTKGLLGVTATGIQGGAGGVAGTGDLTIPGGDGGSAWGSSTATVNGISPAGGSSYFGQGGGSVAQNSTGTTAGKNAPNYGGGGSGAVSYNSAATAAGGNGAKGVVIITEFVQA